MGRRSLRWFVGRDPWLYKVARFILRGTVAPWFCLEASGAACVPASGPVLLAVNHQSDLDGVFVGLSLARPLRYMTEAEKFRVPVLPHVISRLGSFPIERGQADRRGIKAALGFLRAGEAVVVFPEGNPFGEMHAFRPGVGMVAVRGGVPVTPVAIVGAARLQSWGWLARPKVSVRFGAPIDVSDLPRDIPSYGEAAGRVQRAVVELCGGVG